MLPLNYVIFMPYGFLFLFMTVFGAIFSLSASHWLGVWAGLEINLIAFIPLMLYRGTVLETESAIKYFIFQAVGSAMIMFSSLLSFGSDFVWDLATSNLSLFMESGMIILIIGLLLKLGVFPFHFWFPSVVSGLSWFSGFLLLTWQKIAPLFLLFLVSYLWGASVMLMIMVVAGGSSIVGGVGGVNQTQLRALLAYSSIAHLGWMVFCCFLSEGSMKIYFSVYFFITMCIFFVVWMAEVNLVFQAFSSFVGKNLVVRFIVIFLFLSLGGIPPLLGFVPKWVVLSLGSETGMVFVLGLLILGSLFSLFYYLGLIFSAFFSAGPVLLKEFYFPSLSRGAVMFVVLSGVANLLGGLFLLVNFIY
uniref:NADH dehydrogenase subunit 2 n=1 Tax=Dracogyra subfusca TaxID=2038759 RepID=UPI0021D536B0|nr:NADH dehydrogenase subunit 2 [Dracogyra subfuscus]UXG19116.1 NADH dehydrogenase subunit 2 [Dracogyra subfuscus]